MRVDLFDFELPEEQIALRPANPRDSARMLIVNPEHKTTFEDRIVRELPELLRAGDALVFNDTKVIPAQLEGYRLRDEMVASVGLTLHMRMSGDTWKAFARGAKKLQPGDRLIFGEETDGKGLGGVVVDKGDGGEVEVCFNVSGPLLDEALVRVGHIPLPPYIALKRGEDEQDRTDYQTVYAREEGAVAAPTAGLHFTPELLEQLDNAGIERHFVTLHVGAGTFLPVKAEDTDDHQMHAEIGHVGEETAMALNRVRKNGGRIVSVGTTSLRLLESAAGEDGTIHPWRGATDIFIQPGYRFRAIDVLMTNFHLPKSTLFMLVSAFCGLETMRSAYDHAVRSGYRFYSYGDSSLLFRKD